MTAPGHQYFIINKPYGMESQFISQYRHPLLGDLQYAFPEGTHAIGRLDKPSEGLLLLTTNKKITRLLFQGEKPHARMYLVQVSGQITDEAIAQIRAGVPIRVEGGGYYTTQPCAAERVTDPQALYPHVGEHDQPRTSWVLITLTEGKFRQVRKMVQAVRFRCRRLIRLRIENLGLDGLEPGGVRKLSEEDFFRLLFGKEPEEREQQAGGES
ncbi:MAG TPA: pseudouridine synthase [Chitinophagaceae bacterium]|nr:pseudouridine synthase [Chitinophagaceae bacterium]